MTQPNDSFASHPALAQSALGRSSYFALFGTQTIGAVFLIWTGLLVYREVLADPVSHETHPWAIVGSLSSIALMQICYWVSYRVRPPLPQFQNALLGHAILLLARMIYVLPTSIFGFVFIAQRPEFEIPSTSASSFFWVSSPCSATCAIWSASVGFSLTEKRAPRPDTRFINTPLSYAAAAMLEEDDRAAKSRPAPTPRRSNISLSRTPAV